MEHADLVELTAYMAEVGYSAAEIAYAVEKPWKHEELLADAREAEWRERQRGYAIIIEPLPDKRPPLPFAAMAMLEEMEAETIAAETTQRAQRWGFPL